MREKIWLVIQEGVRDKESYDVMGDGILTLISEEIQKGLLTDEEIQSVFIQCDYEDTKVSCPLPVEPLRYERAIAQAQLQKILALFNKEKVIQQEFNKEGYEEEIPR